MKVVKNEVEKEPSAEDYSAVLRKKHTDILMGVKCNSSSCRKLINRLATEQTVDAHHDLYSHLKQRENQTLHFIEPEEELKLWQVMGEYIPITEDAREHSLKLDRTKKARAHAMKRQIFLYNQVYGYLVDDSVNRVA